MKFTNQVVFLVGLGALALSACNKSSAPQPTPPVVSTQDVVFQLGMKGYATTPNAIGRFGVATSASDAQIGKGSELTGSISWVDTKGGKETKPYLLANRPKGSKYWVFLSTHQKPTGTQSVTLNWPVTGSAVLNASSPDTLIVQEFIVQ